MPELPLYKSLLKVGCANCGDLTKTLTPIHLQFTVLCAHEKFSRAAQKLWDLAKTPKLQFITRDIPQPEVFSAQVEAIIRWVAMKVRKMAHCTFM